MATGDTLMTSTLPTLVGMGVVSRTTDTMFGRGGRGKSAGSARKGKKHAGKAQKASAWKKGPYGREYVVHRGPRGGKYILRRGRRVYV